jgi:exonuclease III
LLKILFLLLISLILNANTFSVASYNVENLFDLKEDGNEYSEFVPNTKSNWNENSFNIKITNLLKVINDLNTDIIALQEVENEELMKLLLQKLPQYKFYSFIKYPDSSVGLGFLSKIEIKNNSFIDVKFQTKNFRPILETTFIYKNIEFKIFNNHWASKKSPESYRIKFAKNLQDRVLKLPLDYDYILLGDFNSDYNEMDTFRTNQRLNNTQNITGINQILNSVIDDKFITSEDILNTEKKVHYNLWLEIPRNNRFSSKFREENTTPDNILLPFSLFDNKKLSYVSNSFSVFKPNYLYENNIINRWQIDEINGIKIHKTEGYSDHLPIYAKFFLNKNSLEKENIKTKKSTDNFHISDLYNKENLNEPITIKNVNVIYKDDEKAIIKQQNNRAILIYKNTKDLKLGYSYNLLVNQIYNYNGLKEIKEFIILNELEKNSDYKSLYLDAKNIDLSDFKYENEIITNLKGVLKKSNLYLENGKMIKLYVNNKNILPKNTEEITIISGHLATYRGNIQIILYSQSDFKIGF